MALIRPLALVVIALASSVGCDGDREKAKVPGPPRKDVPREAVTFIALLHSRQSVTLSPAGSKRIRDIVARPPRRVEVPKRLQFSMRRGYFWVDGRRYEWRGSFLYAEVGEQHHTLWNDPLFREMDAVAANSVTMSNDEVVARLLDVIEGADNGNSGQSDATAATTRAATSRPGGSSR